MSRPPRPAEVCRLLLQAIGTSDGRRRKRKRDTTPDALGLAIKRWLLEEVVRYDPESRDFEAWLLDCARGPGPPAGPFAEGSPGAVLAMGRSVLEEWRLAIASPGFLAWLNRGAPSDDRQSDSDQGDSRAAPD